MVLYTVIGDPHAKPDNLDKINTLFDIIEDLGHPVVWLGDLLDTKEVVRGKCLNAYIKRFQASKLDHFVIVGNHDWFNLECKDHALQALKPLKNVCVIDDFSCDEDAAGAFVPYTHDPDQMRKWIKQVDPSWTLFCHADIKGFDYGNGLISVEGLEVSDFKKIKRVVSGHYHKYQQVKNIIYLGTPFSHSFGESNQDKHIGIYNPNTHEMEYLNTPFPQHISWTWELPNGGALAYHEGDYHRVILKGTQEEIDKVHRIEGVRYIEQPIDVGHTTNVVSEGDSSEVQFVKWAADIKGYSDDLIKLGLEILEDV